MLDGTQYQYPSVDIVEYSDKYITCAIKRQNNSTQFITPVVLYYTSDGILTDFTIVSNKENSTNDTYVTKTLLDYRWRHLSVLSDMQDTNGVCILLPVNENEIRLVLTTPTDKLKELIYVGDTEFTLEHGMTGYLDVKIPVNGEDTSITIRGEEYPFYYYTGTHTDAFNIGNAKLIN